MVDATSLATAALFLTLALLCWKWSKEHRAAESKEISTRRPKSVCVQGAVMGGRRANVASMFSPPDHILFVEYPVGCEEKQGTLQVSAQVFRQYSGTLKQLQREYKKTGNRPSKDRMPSIKLQYEKKHPENVWCEGSVQGGRNQARTFMVLSVVCLAAAAFFGAAGIAG